MPHDTVVDVLLGDSSRPPVQWHRLIHATLGYQLHASPDLAMVTALHGRLGRAGIATTIQSAWLSTDTTPREEPR